MGATFVRQLGYLPRTLISALLRPRAWWLQWLHRDNVWERRDLSIEDLVGGAQEWDEVGELAMAFLRDMGLKPDSTVLDAGCGSFRVGWRLINYLEPNKYAAFDGSRYLLEEGAQKVLHKHCDVYRKRPDIRHLFLDDQIVQIGSEVGKRFDFILVHAIFDHLPRARIKVFLQSLASAMHHDTRLFATFFLNPSGESFTRPIRRVRNGVKSGAIWTYTDREYWHHTPAFFERVCGEIGTLRYITYYDYAYPIAGLKMAEFRLGIDVPQ
jgi:SAM-dependent methyltransferase